MRIRRLWFAAAAAAGLAAPAAAQDLSTKAYLSPLPALEQTKDGPSADVTAKTLKLRPNIEQFVYVFVFNPGKDPETVHVVLAAGAKAGEEIAKTGAPVVVAGGETKRIALAPTKAPPPAPAPVLGADGKPLPAPPANPGMKLDDAGSLVLRVYDADAKAKIEKPGPPKPEERRSAEVGLQLGNDIDIKPTVKDGVLTVAVEHASAGDNTKFTDKPFKVKLDLRADLNPGLDPATLTQGVFEADLPVGGKVTLVAEGVKFKKDSKQTLATISVGVDGYDRLALFETDFKNGTPTPKKKFFNVRLGETAVITGKPVKVAVETFDYDAAARFNLLVGRADGTGSDTLLKAKPPRQSEIYVKPGGENDALVFTTVLKDWELVYPTNGVAGKRVFKVEEGGEARTNTLVVDRTPPVVKFTANPKDADLEIGKKPVTLSATASDAESDIARVLFFVGDFPGADLKPAPGGKIVAGKPKLDKDGKVIPGEYTAEIRLPEKAGEIKVGVVAVNGVGLATAAPDEPKELVIRDKEAEKKKKTTGSIEGKVVQGSRAQPGLTVTLLDATGKTPVKSTKTDADGKFKFEDVAPATYVVKSVKTADVAQASGKKEVAVEAGDKPATVEISVSR